MKNKGFTLIEILAVLVLLTIIVVTVYPYVKDAITNSEEKAYDTQIASIKKAAEEWALKKENISNLPDRDGEVLTINLGDLKISGLLPLDIKNPISDEFLPNDMLITITKNKNYYDVAVLVDSASNTEEFEVNSNSPVIMLNGSYLTYVELNEQFIDEGASAKRSNGENLDLYITQEIIKDNIPKAMIDTSMFGTYMINYIIIDPESNLKNIAVRTVVIRDTTSPIIDLEESTTIQLTDVMNFNPLSGVSVSDNSGENININLIGNVEASVGSYILNYCAKDSSNNETCKKRIVKVI